MTAEEYQRIHRDHGIAIPFDQHYLHSLKQLLITDAHESLNQLKSNLISLAVKKSAQDLFTITQSVVDRNKATASNGTMVFYQTLERMCFIYRVSKELHQKVSLVKTEHTEPTSATKQSKTLVLSLDELNEAFPEATVQKLVDCVTLSLALLKTLQTLPPIEEPYDPEIEKIVSENILSVGELFLNLEELTLIAEKIDKNPRQTELLIKWLNESSMSLFGDIINALYIIRYDTSIIHLSTKLIDLLQAINRDCDEEQTRYLIMSVHGLKDNMINSMISSGQYAPIMYWLPYFEKIFSTLQTKAQYDCHLQQAADHNYRALVAQHLCEYKAARYHLDKAWECMANGLHAFVDNSPTDVESFENSIVSVLQSIALCYQALGIEQFESSLFVDAAATFLQCSDQTERDYHTLITHTVNKLQNKTVVRTQNKAQENQVRINDTRINLNWCVVANFLLIKRWLSANTPPNTTLSDKDGSLILSSLDKSAIRRFSELLTEQEVIHTTSTNSITFDEFTKLDIAAIKKALSKSKKKEKSDSKEIVPLSSELSLSLQPSANLESVPLEELKFRRLKSMHYKSLHHYDQTYFQLLEKKLALFYYQCQNPFLKIKALELLVSTKLIQSLSIWTRDIATDPDHFKCLSAAKEYAEAGQQFFMGRESLKNPEINAILHNITERIKTHQTILEEYLKELDIFKLRKVLGSHMLPESADRLYFLSVQLGTEKIISHYSAASGLRKRYLKATLCCDKATYTTRRELICQSTLFCFEIAYELLTQENLLNIEHNSKEIALGRIQEELRILLEVQASMGLKFSATIESYILVVQTKTEKNLSLDSALKLLESAFKLVDKNKNTVHSALILLAKIEHILEQAIKDPFLKIKPYLNELFDFIKKISTDRTLINENNNDYVAHEVCQYILCYLALSQESLLLFDLESLNNSFKQQLSIVQYYERTLCSGRNLSKIRLIVKNHCGQITARLNKSMKTIAAIGLEKKVRQDLIFENEISEDENLLIQKVLLSQQNLSTFRGQLISPNSPLISLMVGCNDMFQYPCCKVKLGKNFSKELSESYLLIADVAKHWVTKFLPAKMLKVLSGDDEGKNWFEPLTQLIACLNNAHFAIGLAISAEHIPLIRSMYQLYPENPYLSFTLFEALTVNSSKDTHCPEAVEACFKAAKAGHSHAEYWAARLLESGDYGAERNPDLAAVYLERSNQQGYYKAQLHMARSDTIGFFARTHAKAAMMNPETPNATRIELMDTYGITYIPSQVY